MGQQIQSDRKGNVSESSVKKPDNAKPSVERKNEQPPERPLRKSGDGIFNGDEI